MNGKYLLDTNIAIALLQGNPDVLKRIGEAADVFVPVIVMGELYFGAEKSGKRDENIAKAERLAAQSQLLPVDLDTARRFGEVKQQLRSRGRPIPENDVWIAAMALQHALTLATRDVHFNEVPSLTVEKW